MVRRLLVRQRARLQGVRRPVRPRIIQTGPARLQARLRIQMGPARQRAQLWIFQMSPARLPARLRIIRKSLARLQLDQMDPSHGQT